MRRLPARPPRWTVKDTVITSGRNFTYAPLADLQPLATFSTFAPPSRPSPDPAAPAPPAEPSTSVCTSRPLPCVDEEGKTKTLSAYQVANNADACYALSDGSEGKWKLLGMPRAAPLTPRYHRSHLRYWLHLRQR